MGLWMKKNGEFIPVSGGSGGDGSEPHDHDDYLPLAGGTLTGDLQVDGNVKFHGRLDAQEGSKERPAITFNNTGSGFYAASGYLATSVGGVTQMSAYNDRVEIFTSLESNGQLHCQAGSFSRPAITFDNTTSGFYGGGGYVATNVNGVTQFAAYNDRVEVFTNLKVNGTINGQTVFGIADGIDTRDVLDRAETAAMPVDGDEGVGTTDAEVESVTVNEVVTALLAKVKELSDRIEELEGS